LIDLRELVIAGEIFRRRGARPTMRRGRVAYFGFHLG
jgi:hypothetical protein